MRVLVIGSNGQLGTDLMEVLASDPTFEPVGVTHSDIDISSPSAVEQLVGREPDAIINTAAFHKTDVCEVEPKRTFEVNAIGALNVATACKVVGALDIFQSTDYVFGGSKQSPYREEDATGPINVYGISKLAGEQFTRIYCPEHYVVRSSGLFGVAGSSGKGGNFVESILKQARSGAEVRVVDDITLSPTYTKDSAEAIAGILKQRVPYGTYHVTNTGSCTWWQFASEIIRIAGMDTTVGAISASAYPAKARRPRMSALSNAKLRRSGILMRTYQAALRDYLISKGHI